MKFEIVGFYPLTEKNYRGEPEDFLGTLHIHLPEIGLDIRGIRVVQQKKDKKDKLFFYMPSIVTNDGETGEKVRYPVVRWLNNDDQKSMIKFMHENAPAVIRDEMSKCKRPNFEQKRPETKEKKWGNLITLPRNENAAELKRMRA